MRGRQGQPHTRETRPAAGRRLRGELSRLLLLNVRSRISPRLPTRGCARAQSLPVGAAGALHILFQGGLKKSPEHEAVHLIEDDFLILEHRLPAESFDIKRRERARSATPIVTTAICCCIP